MTPKSQIDKIVKAVSKASGVHSDHIKDTKNINRHAVSARHEVIKRLGTDTELQITDMADYFGLHRRWIQKILSDMGVHLRQIRTDQRRARKQEEADRLKAMKEAEANRLKASKDAAAKAKPKVMKRRFYDCVHYGECLSVASRKSIQTNYGTFYCNNCERYQPQDYRITEGENYDRKVGA